MQNKSCKCPFCGDEVFALRQKIVDGTKKIVSACEDCWTYSNAFWSYESDGKFPAFKGIMPGSKVWCKNVYEDNTEEWVKGIVKKITTVRAGNKFMFIYTCTVEDEDEYIDDIFWEEEIWVRDNLNFSFVDDLELSNLELSNDDGFVNIELNEELYIYSYADFFNG